LGKEIIAQEAAAEFLNKLADNLRVTVRRASGEAKFVMGFLRSDDLDFVAARLADVPLCRKPRRAAPQARLESTANI